MLRDQVARIHAQRRACQFAEMATDLPGLIRNLHTALDTRVDHGELLELAVSLHVHVTRRFRPVAPGAGRPGRSDPVLVARDGDVGMTNPVRKLPRPGSGARSRCGDRARAPPELRSRSRSTSSPRLPSRPTPMSFVT
ncbi:MAG: hypothetical protein ACRDTT_16955 [Pseudonocardiaceae bacterium]